MECRCSYCLYTFWDNNRSNIATRKCLLPYICYWTIKCNYTLTILVGVANDVCAEAIGFIWRDYFSIGGGVVN